MSLDHQVKQLSQNLIKGWLLHLLSTNSKNLSPLGISGVLDPQVIDLTLRDLTLGCRLIRARIDIFANGILLNLVDLFYS